MAKIIRRQIRKNGVRKLSYVWIAEKALGKTLPYGAEVHHIDGDPSNNDPFNLVVCPDQSYHKMVEYRTRAFEACGSADYCKCQFCKNWDSPNLLKKSVNKYNKSSYYHVSCKKEYQTSWNEKNPNYSEEWKSKHPNASRDYQRAYRLRKSLGKGET